MENYGRKKLTLKDVLCIGQDTLLDIELQIPENTPWYFLQKLMALNSKARNTTLIQCDYDEDLLCSGFEQDLYCENDFNTSNSLHPLDVLCVLLHCSDAFLQQEIVTKMCMCQFAVPLLLPSSDGTNFTLMLWAMREIVKSWRPQSLAESKGFMEHSLVQISMPTFSFVRIGKCNLSKSRILNLLLSQTQSHYDYFVNIDMECGNIPRKISNGLVEISWYFPGSVTGSDNYPEPIAITNLRGDLVSNWKQFMFLTKVSSAVFIFAENLTEKEYDLLTNCRDGNANYYFIVDSSAEKHIYQRTVGYLKKLFPELNMKHFLFAKNSRNVTDLVRKIQNIIVDFIKNPGRNIKLEEMVDTASAHGINIDENMVESQQMRERAWGVVKEITDVLTYKREKMKLQGELWKELSKTEKEMCRMRMQGNNNGSIYRSKLEKKCVQLRGQQYQHCIPIPVGISNFINAITGASQEGKHFFLKWIKWYLDSIARKNLSMLQAQHKDKCKTPSQQKQLYQKMSDSSLGVEHFLREIGQFYEAEYFRTKQEKLNKTQRKFNELPGIAADILLDGFPLELIDGDASNIPIQWISDVLTEMDKKTGGGCKLRVITVLGVQSSGKSTLLNTMFGLQFPVASGRCTRGAFMTLIRVNENFKMELGCDFILVIDTEGLKAPELASLEDSYEHDNELATLVVGLSDITIVNISMENTTEMKNTLQIVVHAFLRMNEIGKKPICQIVHQNVSDVAAHDKNKRNRDTLLQELNEMTTVAAKMEKINKPMTFSDIIDYNPDTHSWYIPGLWRGGPPMDPVNLGYSEQVSKFKTFLFQLMKGRKSPGPQNISSLIQWITSLWNAVKHETFIFNFMNILVAQAYEQLSTKYNELEWKFKQQVHLWLTEKETFIKNQPINKLEEVCSEILEKSMNEILDKEEAQMIKQLTDYFDSGCNNVHYVEKYRVDFINSVKCFRMKQEALISRKCTEAYRIQKGKEEIKNIENNNFQIIDEKFSIYLENRKWESREMSDAEVKQEFDTLWNSFLSDLHVKRLDKHIVEEEMLDQLKNEMKDRGPAVNQKLQSIKRLAEYAQRTFDVEKNDLNIKLFSSGFVGYVTHTFTSRHCTQIKNIVLALQVNCENYVSHIIGKKEDYNEMYTQQLLNMINDRLAKDDIKKLHPTPLLELKIKLHILGKAAPQFQKMHDEFGQNNDPRLLLNKLKQQYFSIFLNTFQKHDESKLRAQKFCEECLKPAIVENINQTLGYEIINDVLKSADGNIYKNRSYFQYVILKELLEINTFENYLEYVSTYERFLEKWILSNILKKYKNSQDLMNLLSGLLSSVTNKIRFALKHPNIQKGQNITEFLDSFCTILNRYLWFAPYGMKAIAFQNNVKICKFSTDVEFFLTKMEEEILSIMKNLSFESIISNLTLKPHIELLEKIVGCGRKCPFCNAPCEAAGAHHKNHFVSAHRPKGLAQCTWANSNALCNSVCSTDILCNDMFSTPETEGQWCSYKDYRKIYPEWTIHPEKSSNSSNYWKYVLKAFNLQFAKHYNAEPASIPDEWQSLTQKHALQSLKKIYNVK
ncbi:up-regulator of cell proliferation-like [Bombina bombina]|uniref:up-regulator of cell proliferation-like n=1 Tax=Bombina bombina TaxID=8345 RepID=UPI00235A8A2C|nr:up-regulator of cell proliferation-like [Bombina bombina]